MVTNLATNVRLANIHDRHQIANLLHFDNSAHRHLDWRSSLDWIGNNPYLVLERNHRITAALACPPDPMDVAWIRLFAVSEGFKHSEGWYTLWPEAINRLELMPQIRHIAAIPMHSWMQELIEGSGFIHTHNVVMLAWDYAPQRQKSAPKPEITLRPMNYDDLEEVEAVDMDAFKPIWRNSKESLEYAYRQASLATVAELDGLLIGYQISTSTPFGGHLARLAIASEHQSKGFGQAILQDLIGQFLSRGITHISVNTQNDNEISLTLYQKNGFRYTGEEHPVYELRNF